MILFVAGIFIGSAVGVIAVSYTHLDVYKRQVYNDVRDKLIAKGIPPEEIAFIHDANTEVRKKELFSKVRSCLLYTSWV